MNNSTSLKFAVILTTVLAGASAGQTQDGIFESRAELTVQNKIDQLVFVRWKKSSQWPRRSCAPRPSS